MKLGKLIERTLKEHNSLLLLDIDDTLVKPNNIYIYRKLPTDKEEVALTPEQFAEENITPQNKQYYDFREFKNPEKVAKSIKTGIPLLANLKMVDSYVSNGWTIGVLTARGMEEVVFKSLKAWMKIRNNKDELEEIGPRLVRNLVHAINDDTKNYPGETSAEKKANVIKKLANQFDRIVFLDDDESNLELVRDLELKNVIAKKAK